ncbi:hypothetical protein EJ08DRAFT_736081 [Tothia fuscella]|uniref:F-box domain-containing protein n=1 Tax=Tothia fuscella TaxID=1048955 RepID=A0A9P4NM61_9PEZI|nr:hypothetical protein EJ08DRAFT_736081 [Tothia fuscella]
MASFNNLPTEIICVILLECDSLSTLRRASIVSQEWYAAFLFDKDRILPRVYDNDDHTRDVDTYFETLPEEGRSLVVETWVELLEDWDSESGVDLGQVAANRFQSEFDSCEEEIFSLRNLLNATGEFYVSPAPALKYFCEDLVLPAHKRGQQSALTEEDISTLRLWKRFVTFGNEDNDATFRALLSFPHMAGTWTHIKQAMKQVLSCETAIQCHAVQDHAIRKYIRKEGYLNKGDILKADVANAIINQRKDKELFHYLSLRSDLVHSAVEIIGEPLSNSDDFTIALEIYEQDLADGEDNCDSWGVIEMGIRRKVEERGVGLLGELWEMCESELDGYEITEFLSRYGQANMNFVQVLPTELQWMVLASLDNICDLRRATLMSRDWFDAFISDKARILAAVKEQQVHTEAETEGETETETEAEAEVGAEAAVKHETTYFDNLTPEGKHLCTVTWLQVLEEWRVQKQIEDRGVRGLEEVAIRNFQAIPGSHSFSIRDYPCRQYSLPALDIFWDEPASSPVHAASWTLIEVGLKKEVERRGVDFLRELWEMCEDDFGDSDADSYQEDYMYWCNTYLRCV